MAIEHGNLGAWSAVRTMVASDLPSCSGISDLRAAIEDLAGTFEEWPTIAQREIDERMAALQKLVPAQMAEVERLGNEALARIAPERAQLAARVEKLRAFWFAPLRWYYNRWVVPTILDRDRELERHALLPARAALRQHDAMKVEYDTLTTKPQSVLAQKLLDRTNRLARLKAAAASPEAAGAAGELEMRNLLLQGLSDEFHVLHDVHVELRKSIRIDGNYRKTAQIDHVVVGPAGVFTIEVKRWSQKFAASEKYFDPCDQAASASRLLFVMLKDHGHDTKVRSIVAASTSVPAPKEGKYVKIMRPEGVCGYIQYFSQAIHLNEVKALVDVLRRYQN